MTDIEKYLLTVLGEEGSEVAQDASKAIRFGIHDINMLNPTGPTNVERLVKEANEFLAVMDLLVRLGTIPPDWQNPAVQAAKVAKVKAFMCYSIKAGQLDVKPGQVFDGQIYCPLCGEFGEFHDPAKKDCKGYEPK